MDKKIANLCGYKYKDLGAWAPMYHNIITSLEEMGYEIRISPFLNIPNLKDVTNSASIGIIDNENDLFIYNHTYPEELKELGYFTSKNSIFLKPTGPTNKHYSIDPLGYSSRISITYNKPDFENTDYQQYWDSDVNQIKEKKLHKWTNEYELQENTQNIPDDHILIIGQMPGDTSVKEFSFSNHIEDIERIVDRLDSKDPIVIKLHPFLKDRSKKEYWDYINKKIIYFEKLGHTVIQDMVDIHTILPKTKLAIVENSTAGIECMMYDVPMITFGCPEYRWISKELRHIINLNIYKNDLSWFNKELSRKFLVWYVRDWLCYDVESTKRRLKEVLF